MGEKLDTGSELPGRTNSNSSQLSHLGYHRFPFLNSTTMNWLRGGSKNSTSGAGIRKKDISNPIPIVNERLLAPVLTSIVQETSGSVPDRDILRVHQISPTNGFDPLESRVALAAPLGSDRPPYENADIGNSSLQKDGNLREPSAPKMAANERAENVCIPEKAMPPGPSRGASKKAAIRIRMALSILKRRSNSNLRKTFDSAPGKQRLPTIKPGTTEIPTFPDTRNRKKQNNPTLTLTQATPVVPMTSLNLGSSRIRTVLTKQSPGDARRRRATVASLRFDDSLGSTERSRQNTWLRLDGRPSSSQSSIPGMTTIQGDDFSAMSALNPDENGGAANGSVAGGGLHPRPSSLRRHWSDGPHGKRESSASVIQEDRSNTYPAARASQGRDRLRPLSFSGMYSGSMKITEAVSVESRIRELEAQVSTLQSLLAQQRLPDRSTEQDEHAKSDIQSPDLESPFQERPVTASSASTFLRKETSTVDESATPPLNGSTVTVDWSSIARGCPPTPPVAPFDQTHNGMRISNEIRRYGRGVFSDSEGKPEPSISASKRSTVSTVTPDRDRGKGQGAEYHRAPMAQNTIALAEYTSLISMVKREQRARRRLESRISRLQEQMALVLHRQLIMQDQQQRALSPSITEASIRRSDFASIHTKPSSEVPIPDLIPPRAEMTPTAFPEFDSSISMTGSEFEGSYNDEPEGSELWETPTEERQSISDSRSDFSILHHGHHKDRLIPPPPMPPRTMSISQITERASSVAR